MVIGTFSIISCTKKIDTVKRLPPKPHYEIAAYIFDANSNVIDSIDFDSIGSLHNEIVDRVKIDTGFQNLSGESVFDIAMSKVLERYPNFSQNDFLSFSEFSTLVGNCADKSLSQLAVSLYNANQISGEFKNVLNQLSNLMDNENQTPSEFEESVNSLKTSVLNDENLSDKTKFLFKATCSVVIASLNYWTAQNANSNSVWQDYKTPPEACGIVQKIIQNIGVFFEKVFFDVCGFIAGFSYAEYQDPFFGAFYNDPKLGSKLLSGAIGAGAFSSLVHWQ